MSASSSTVVIRCPKGMLRTMVSSFPPGEYVHPPFIERGPDLGGDHGVHPDAVLEIGCGPFALRDKMAPWRRCSRWFRLPRERGLGELTLRMLPLLFSIPDAVVRHRVVMDEVASSETRNASTPVSRLTLSLPRRN